MSDALTSYRKTRGITQETLAEEIGVSSITVSRWETGARKIDTELVPVISEKTGIAPALLRPDLAYLFKAVG